MLRKSAGGGLENLLIRRLGYLLIGGLGYLVSGGHGLP